MRCGERIGFGHCSRAALVIEALLRQGVPATSLFVVTNAIQEPFDGIVAKGVTYRHALIDAGVVQPAAYRVDAMTTLRNLRAFLDALPTKMETEVTWLRAQHITHIFADAPFLAWYPFDILLDPSECRADRR